MKLNGHSARDMLIIRMQAYAYEHVRMGAINTAQRHADYALERFDNMIEHNPTDSAGFWAGYYFDRFKSDCEG